MELITPPRKEKIIKRLMLMWLVRLRIPMMVARVAAVMWVARRTFFFGNMSTILPPKRERMRVEIDPEAVTTPTQKAE